MGECGFRDGIGGWHGSQEDKPRVTVSLVYLKQKQEQRINK